MTQAICEQDKSRYQSWTVEQLEQHIRAMQQVLTEKRVVDVDDTSLPVRLNALARAVYPDGYVGKNFVDVEVEDLLLELRVFHWNDKMGTVEFGLFPPGSPYPRKRISVDNSGRINDRLNVYVAPRHQLPIEPVFTWPVESILRVLYARLRAEEAARERAVQAACMAAAV